MPTPTRFDPIAELASLPGVGPARAARLARIGVQSVRDLLLVHPRRLVEWPAVEPLAEALRRKGARVRVRGRVLRTRLVRLGGKRSVVRATLGDASGEGDLVFFNQPWMQRQLEAGRELEVCGDVVVISGARALGAPRLASDAAPFPAPGTLEPEYEGGDGVSGDALAALIAVALERHGEDLEEPLPEDLLAARGLPTLARAVRALHTPSDREAFEDARRRLAFEPILALQARLQLRRARTGGSAPRVRVSDPLHAELLGAFPFTPTDAQRRVIEELRRDLDATRPMRRLLQGDVGAGKTAVAAWAALAAVEAGRQVAFMAPTEVLASQHHYGLRELFEARGIRTELVTGSLRAAERRDVTERLARGELDLVFGTHALFSDDVVFPRLGLVVIDEQHRFGVNQRARLAGKARGDADVHLLLLTATPIPRTLALTLYGDLEVSILDAPPPGRGELRTRWVQGQDRRKIPKFLAERLAAGEQVYWVVPRIDGGVEAGADGAATERDELASQATGAIDATGDHGATKDGAKDGAKDGSGPNAEQRFRQLAARAPLAQAGIELVHGRLPAEERRMRLDRFRRGEVGLLVATTVVEVGVDVPNATVMVIEDAHRLGLAQLHQLRGRVGRGTKGSWCLLLGDMKAEARLRLLERSRDGFLLAEEDLRKRGMGDLLGVRQSGENFEGLEDPDRDLDLLLAARDLFQRRPDLVAAYAARAPEALAP
ncbi:MAG: ATP-dependent DNA helicase RecG [Planctomycetota bacterium]